MPGFLRGAVVRERLEPGMQGNTPWGDDQSDPQRLVLKQTAED